MGVLYKILRGATVAERLEASTCKANMYCSPEFDSRSVVLRFLFNVKYENLL